MNVETRKELEALCVALQAARYVVSVHSVPWVASIAYREALTHVRAQGTEFLLV